MKLFSAETFVTVLVALVVFKLLDALFLDRAIGSIVNKFEEI